VEIKCARSEGKYQSDGVHRDARGSRLFGERYALPRHDADIKGVSRGQKPFARGEDLWCHFAFFKDSVKDVRHQSLK
jgi:hypothetical protein